MYRPEMVVEKETYVRRQSYNGEKAELIEPFPEAYNKHAEYKKIPLTALEKLESPMHLICVTPTKIEVLFSELKKEGYSSRQTLEM